MEDMRPDWDSWLISLAFMVSQRSLDKHTKCGCVVVDDSHTILSMGYNSPPRGLLDEVIPLERPAKYAFMEHAESNAIINAARTGIPLLNSNFYITGPPCHACFRKILNVGAKRIVYGPILHQRTQEEIDAIKLMNRHSGGSPRIEMVKFDGMQNVFRLLVEVGTYIEQKVEETRESEKSTTCDR